MDSQSESESEPEPEPVAPEINVIDDRSFIILDSTEECRWVRLTDGTPIDDQIPLPYFTRFISGKQSTYLYVETASGRFANTIFSKLDYFAGVLDQDTPDLRRKKALRYYYYLRNIYLRKWPAEAIKTFIKQQTAFKLAAAVLWEKMRDGELPQMGGSFDWMFNGLIWFENRVQKELEPRLKSLDPEKLRQFLFNFDFEQRVQTLQNEFHWPPFAALMFSYTIENMELPEIKNMFDNDDSLDYDDLTDLEEVMQELRSTL